MRLVERLGFQTLDDLYARMDNNEIMEWAAYDLTNDKAWVDEQEKQRSLEIQREQGLEEEAKLIRAMFDGLGSKK